MSEVLDARQYAGSTFPLTAPAPGAFLADPVAVGLCDFLAFWLNKDLNPWLAQIAAPTMTGNLHSPTAVPAPVAGKPAEQYRYAHDPANHWVRNKTPSLYVWYESHREEEYTLVLRQRISTYGIFYVGDETVGNGGAEQYAGIAALASRSISNACDAQRHASYGYNGDPDGTPIWKSLGIRGWRVERLEYGAMQQRPNVGVSHGGQHSGDIVRFFPALQGTLTVWENVNQPIPRDPQDVAGDMSVDLRVNEQGDIDNPVDFMTRYAPGPDGSEQDG